MKRRFGSKTSTHPKGNEIVLYIPKSSESHVEVSVPVIRVDADSVDVFIVVSALDATDVPITITLGSNKHKHTHTKYYSMDLLQHICCIRNMFSGCFVVVVVVVVKTTRILPLAHVELADAMQ